MLYSKHILWLLLLAWLRSFRMQTTAAAAGAGCYLSQPGSLRRRHYLFH